MKERAHPKEVGMMCHIEAYNSTSQLLKYKWKNSRAHVKQKREILRVKGSSDDGNRRMTLNEWTMLLPEDMDYSMKIVVQGTG